MKYDFDKVINRWNTSCEKYDMITEKGYPQDMIPLWVADMDFSAPDCVKDAMREVVDRGIFGYSHLMDGYHKAVSGWFERRYGWQIDGKKWRISSGIIRAPATSTAISTSPSSG